MGFLTLFLAISSPAMASTCAPLIGDCSYYSCRQAELGCTSENYLHEFGLRYCLEFQNNEDVYSKQGQKFLDKVRPCLQHALEVNFSCGEVQSIALESHVSCYVNNGFCHIPYEDRLLIASTVSEEMAKSEFQLVMFRILGECSLME